MAVMALRRSGRFDCDQVRHGSRLILDRAIRGGGWNYGNTMVFGADLRPQPAPTGWALLALAGNVPSDAPQVARGCEYLESTLPGTRAPWSLGLGLMALAAWSRLPRQSQAWLETASLRAAQRPDPVLQLAWLLMASSRRSLELLGLPDPAHGTER
jgi:hypothetical protein